MPGIKNILHLIASLPGKINSAQYEEEPIYRERPQAGPISIPGLSLPGEEPGPSELYTGGTGDLQEVGKRRTGRLTKFGNFAKNQLPEILRAGIVAASSPTPGQIGTAGDIFGAIGAVGADKQNRDLLRYQMLRQTQKDALERAKAEQGARLSEARIGEYQAQAARNRSLANNATTKVARKEPYEVYDEFYKRFLDAGMSPMDAAKNAQATTIKNAFGILQAPPKRAEESAQRLFDAMLRKEITPEQYKDRMDALTASTSSVAEATSSGRAAGRAPWVNPRYRSTEQGIAQEPRVVPDTTGKPILEGGGVFRPMQMENGAIARPPVPVARPARQTASEQKLGQQNAVDRIVSRVLQEDTNHEPASALRNVQKFYRDDPEVQQNLPAVITRLQQLILSQQKVSKGSAAQEGNPNTYAPKSKRSTSVAPSSSASDPLKIR